MIELPPTRWPNQVRAFTETLDAFARGVNRLCITSPTGTGKSLVQYDLLRWALSESKAAILFTHRRMLFDQLADNMEREGIPFGRRASGHKEALLRSIQLAMVQSELSAFRVGSRDPHPADLVIVDEYHQFCSDRNQEILTQHVDAGASLVGFTATPLDICGVDELIVAGTPSECREIGALVPPATFAPDEPDLKHIKKYQVGEDLSQADNSKAIMRPGVFGRVVKAWQTHNPEHKPTILFGPDVKGSLFFAEQFVKAGIPAAHIDGDDIWLNGEWVPSSPENRSTLKEALRTGIVMVVCNRFVAREGVDWPFVECLLLATVFGALTSFLQAGGRGLRACPSTGKQKCVVLDFGGNWHRFGSLAEDRIWELGLTNHRVVAERQENFREKKEPEPIRCPSCTKVRAGGRTCPYCGFEAHKNSRLVVQIDGTLKPVVGDVYKPRKIRQFKDTAYKWARAYYRARNSKRGMTFRQAESLFYKENHHWPPRNLPLMPTDPADWYRRVADVPYEQLIPARKDHASRS